MSYITQKVYPIRKLIIKYKILILHQQRKRIFNIEKSTSQSHLQTYNQKKKKYSYGHLNIELNSTSDDIRKGKNIRREKNNLRNYLFKAQKYMSSSSSEGFLLVIRCKDLYLR